MFLQNAKPQRFLNYWKSSNSSGSESGKMTLTKRLQGVHSYSDVYSLRAKQILATSVFSDEQTEA